MKWRRIWHWGLLGLLGLIAILQVLLWIWINPIFERSLTKGVTLVTGGLYQVDSLNVHFSFHNQSLDIRHLNLKIDSTQLESIQVEGESPFLSSIYVPEIHIKFLDFVRLFRKDEIFLERIYLSEPFIYLSFPSSQPKKDSIHTSMEINDLYQLITPRLKGIYINEFEIDKGKLHVGNPGEANHFDAKEVSLFLKNIQVDSTSFRRSNRPLYADYLDFSVNITAYKVILPDSNYQIQAQHLGYATDEERLWIEKLKIHPYQEYDLDDLKNAPANIILEIPYLEIKGFRPGEIFFDRMASLDSILIQNPEIYLSGKAKSGGKSQMPAFKSSNDLYRYVSPYLKHFSTHRMMIRNARLVSALWLENEPFHASIDSFSAHFYSMSIHPDSHTYRDRVLCSEQIDIQLDRLMTNLPDSFHQVNMAKVAYSTRGKRLQLIDLSLTTNQNNLNYQYGMHIPMLHISEINLPQWWNTGKLSLDSLWLDQPVVDFSRKRRNDQKNLYSDQQPIEKAKFLPSYLDSIHVQHILIGEGKLRLSDSSRSPYHVVQLQELVLKIDDFLFSEEDIHKLDGLFNRNDIEIGFKLEDQYWTLPDSSYDIRTQQIEVLSKDSTISLKNVYITPRNIILQNSTVYEIYLPEIDIKGLDMKKAITEKDLDIHLLHIPQAGVKVRQLQPSQNESLLDLATLDIYSKFKEHLHSFHFDTVFLEDFSLRLQPFPEHSKSSIHIPHLSLRALQFHVDSTSHMDADNLFMTKDLFFWLDDYTMSLPDSLHQVTFKRMGYSASQQNFAIDSIRLYPLYENTTNDRWKLNIPGFQIDGVNLYEILTSQKAHFSRFMIDRPSLTFMPEKIVPFQPQQMDTLSDFDLYPLISPFVSELSIEKLRLNQGAFTLPGSQQGQQDFVAKDIFVSIDGWKVDSLSRTRVNKPFIADNIAVNVDVSKYSITLPDSTYRFEFRDIGLSTSDSIFYADSVRLESLPASRNDAVEVELLLDRVQLNGINITQLYFDQVMDLSGLKLIKPNIHLIVHRRPERRDIQREGLDQRDFIPRDPYPDLARILNYIDIEDIAIENARFVLSGKDIKPIGFEDFSFYAFDFRMDSLAYERLDNAYLFAKDFAFILRDYEIPMPDTSLYSIETAKVGLFSRSNYFFIDSLKITPRYGKYQFARKRGYIMDRWDVLIPRIDIRGLDVDHLYRQTGLEAHELSIYLPQFYIYKDKRLPFPEWKRPPMPWQALQELSTAVHLDTVKVYDGHVLYEERNPDTDTIAWFELSETDLKISPVTNNPFWIVQHPKGVIRAEGKLMDKAHMEATVRFPWRDTNHVHSFEGEVGAIPATHLNPILENTGFVSVTSGKIHQAKFRFKADKYRSNGRMRLYYNDLKVNLLSHNMTREQGVVQKVGSGFANAFVVRKDNPRRFLRIGHIGFEREEEKAVLVFWVKSIISGLQSSVGIKSKEMKLKDY